MRSVSQIDPGTGCAYWNDSTGSWAMDGIVLIGFAMDTNASDTVQVGCASMHLTTFTLGSKSTGMRLR